jgi:putative GTP pyrophosphokinase
MSRNVKPEYTKSRVNRAGDNIRNHKENDEDILVIENWRAAHNKILNDWQASLRGRSGQSHEKPSCLEGF